MPDWAVEYFRRAARVAGLPPHMVVCHVAVVAAGRQLQANIAEEQRAEAAPTVRAAPGAPSKAAPSYDDVRTMRRRVTDLWREIERHGAALDAAVSEVSAETVSQLHDVSSHKMAEKLTLLRPRASNSDGGPRPRRRKTPPKGH